MRTTIAIPCGAHHLKFLDKVLESIASGVELPDEVLIVVSPVINDHQREIIEGLQNKFKDSLKLGIMKEKEALSGADARNFLTKFMKEGIILYHDADDTQHPQRVEIVKRFFNEYDIVHLCHSYKFFSEGQAEEIDYETIKIVRSKELVEKYKSLNWEVQAFGSPFMRITAGACCIKREVIEKIWWSGPVPGVDRRFCLEILKNFRKTILIDAPLYNYNK